MKSFEKTGGTKHLALIGIVRRGVPLAQRIAQAMRGIDGVEVPVARWTSLCTAMIFRKSRRKPCCALRTSLSVSITWTSSLWTTSFTPAAPFEPR